MTIDDMRKMIADMPGDAQILIWVQDRDDGECEAVDVHDWHSTGPHTKQEDAVHLRVIV